MASGDDAVPVPLESALLQPDAPNYGKRDWQGVLTMGIKSLAVFVLYATMFLMLSTFNLISRRLLEVVLLASSVVVQAQGFVNLDFESAQLSAYGARPGYVPASNAIPGWSACYVNSSLTDVLTQVSYDGISLGGATISIIDTNEPLRGFGPLQGSYSAFLFSGPIGTFEVSAQISQTGMVPVGTESLLFDAQVSSAPFIVTLGSETITMNPLQSFGNYTLYGGNISLGLAGQTETLTFTEPPPTEPPGPGMLELDNIQFSPEPIPEPSTIALCAIGLAGLTIVRRSLRRRRTHA